jgi:dTDP-4-amino-4,6-dideoxygalactose transaminase
MKYLSNQEISTRVYYPVCLHLQKCFSYLGYSEGDMPVAESLSGSTLALPIFPEITSEEQERVISAIADFYKG